MKLLKVPALTFLTVSTLLLAGLNACRKPAELRIGIIVPLTGGSADFGRWAHNGVELALAELNRQGALSGKRFVGLYEDTQMEPKLGLSAFKKLVSVDEVTAVMTAGSGVVLAIAPEAESTRTVQINYSAVNPGIRKAGQYTFTLVNDAEVEAEEIARFAYQTLGIREIAVAYANASYGVGTRDAVAHSFSRHGGKIVGTVAFPEDFTDVRAQILQLAEMKAQAVYLVATINDSGRLLTQAAELGFKTQWLSYNPFESPEVVRIAGAAADGVIFTSSNPFDLPDTDDKPKQFLDAYVAKYGERPNLYAATAYDAVFLLAHAKMSSDGTREGIQRALASVSGYQGVSGIISFDEDGCAHRPVFIKTVRDGRFVMYVP